MPEKTKRVSPLSSAALGLLITPLFLLSIYSCDDRCGAGNYNAWGMLSTLPHTGPIKFSRWYGAVLFSDGNIVFFDGFLEQPDSFYVFPLKDIVSADTITDVVFYDEYLANRNYNFFYNQEIDTVYSDFLIAVTPLNCIKLERETFNITRFGAYGPDSVRFQNAIYADIHIDGSIHVIDYDDNSIKIFDHNGTFRSKWANLNSPYRLKIYDDFVFILEKENESIKKFSLEGQFIEEIVGPHRFGDITSFSPAGEYMWIVDLGGTRITQIDMTGESIEVKNDFCYMDVNFDFNKVVYIEARVFAVNPYFYIVDYEANLIVDMRYVTYR